MKVSFAPFLHLKLHRNLHTSAAFKSAARRAKLPLDFNRHDLQHRRVTTWLVEGKNPVHVKEPMGHADLATTMGYTHLAKEHLRGLVDEPRRDEARTPA